MGLGFVKKYVKMLVDSRFFPKMISDKPKSAPNVSEEIQNETVVFVGGFCHQKEKGLVGWPMLVWPGEVG